MIYFLALYIIGVMGALYIMDETTDTNIDPENPNEGFNSLIAFEVLFCLMSWFFVVASLMGRRLRDNHN